MKARQNIQCYLGYWVWFGSWGIVWSKSHDVEIVRAAGCVFNKGETETGAVSGKKGIIYSGSCDIWVQLVRYDNNDSYPEFCWFIHSTRPGLSAAEPPGISGMSSLETRFGTCSEECFRSGVLLLHHTPLLPLRPRASRGKLSHSQVVPNLEPSNRATNMPSGRKSTCILGHGMENMLFFALRYFLLAKGRYAQGSWWYTQMMVRSIVPRSCAILRQSHQEGITPFKRCK